jgi:hypothetical protein
MSALGNRRLRFMGAAALVLGTLSTSARAGDRPFLATSSAAAEEDDDAVWSVQTAWQRRGPLRGGTLALEYAIDPTNSAQVEFSLDHDRAAGSTSQAVEFEFKHLFNHIARDGYGLGIVLSAENVRPAGAGWRHGAWSLVLPATWQWGGPRSLLHLNVGVSRSGDGTTERLRSIAIEHEAAKRTTLFVEAAQQGTDRLLHAGLRYWVTRERFAIDVSAQRAVSNGDVRRGAVIGLNWFDL